MAKHRINEDGHLIWFETDEEYQEYLNNKEEERRLQERAEKEWRKKKLKRKAYGCLFVIIVFFILVIIGTCGGKKDKDKDAKNTTKVEKSELTKKDIRNKSKAKKATQTDNETVMETPVEIDPTTEAEPKIEESESATLTFDSNFKW